MFTFGGEKGEILMIKKYQDQKWPLNFQAQLKYENAGDFIVQGPGLSATLNGVVYLATDSYLKN